MMYVIWFVILFIFHAFFGAYGWGEVILHSIAEPAIAAFIMLLLIPDFFRGMLSGRQGVFMMLFGTLLAWLMPLIVALFWWGLVRKFHGL
jgi:hypothetical protein